DPAAGLVAEHVFHQEGNAAERTAAECVFVEALDAIGIGLDDGVDRGIDRLYRLRRDQRELLRRHLSRRDQTGETKRVGARVLRKRQRRVRTSTWRRSATAPSSRACLLPCR